MRAIRRWAALIGYCLMRWSRRRIVHVPRRAAVKAQAD